MPPQRRSARLKRKRAAAEEERLSIREKKTAEEKKIFSFREKKRREIFSALPPSSAVKDVQSMAKGVWSDYRNLQLDATTHLLNLVSLEDNPLIDQVVQTGAVPRLVDFLTRDDYPELQREAARVLINIASGTSENTKIVINSGAVPVFVRLLQSSKLCEQVAWALGNIAGDSPECRDIVLNCGALHLLLTLLNEHSELSFLRVGTWALSNLLDGKPQVPFEQLKSTIQTLSYLILTSDEVVLKEACWALSYLSQYGCGMESVMYEADLCSKLVKLFQHSPSSVLFPAIRTITSIVEGAKTLDERALEVRRRLVLVYRSDIDNFIVKEARDLKCYLDNRMDDIFEVMRDKWIAGKKFNC